MAAVNGIDVIDIKEKNIKGAYVIDGFPSIGLVGSIVANYLVSFLNLEQIAIVDSVYFPSISLIRDGVPLAPVRVYAGALGKKEQEKIVVFVSEFQPSPEILKSLAITIMDWVEDHKCKLVISPEGLLSKEESERLARMAQASQEEIEELEISASTSLKSNGSKAAVYGVGATPAARTTLKEVDVTIFENGVVAGLAGMLLNEGVARDFDVITLLAEAHANYPDARAAAAIMTVIDRMLLHVELDLKPLLEEAAVIEDTLKEIHKRTSTEEEAAKRRSSVMYG
ncbi:MAG TPA: PAC2 family protein [Methanomassiliicoccales archaeon]|nr:PAC2 family protein [Methanomassiliicoccales archaeon]